MDNLGQVQLTELASVSNGAVQLLDTDHGADGLITYTVSLDTSGIDSLGTGIRVRDRERFSIVTDASFPFTHPAVMVHHRRWAGTPHVQWGSFICLYAAPAVEWSPADGMRGLIARLSLWLQRAAIGELDPAAQPLHPPVADTSYKNGWVVVRPDLGGLVPWSAGSTARVRSVFAWCAKQGNRVDVLEWMTSQQLYDRFRAGDLQAQDDRGRSQFVAPLVLISDNLAMEYPRTTRELASSLETFGYPPDELLTVLFNTGTVNKCIDAAMTGPDRVPTMMLLGTPARRLEPGEQLAHITAWQLDDFGIEIIDLMADLGSEPTPLSQKVRDIAHRWLGYSDIGWMVMHEARTEVTHRRDTGSPLQWLDGKNVLVLGCGALGAPIAEFCVRSGVSQLHVIDKGIVTPGILVRQPYNDDDIGFNKAERTALRLSRIRRDLMVTAARADITDLILAPAEPLLQYDLIVDATADISVRAALEWARSKVRDRWPDTISALFGHTAQRGVATVSRTGATGSGHDILRRLAIDTVAHAPAGWRHVAADLFPNPARTERFFPEPGCSAPTFTGSAAEVTALAAALFAAAVSVAGDPAAPMTAVGIDLTPGAEGVRPVQMTWANDLVIADFSNKYEVRISVRALAEMRAESRRGYRLRGSRIETGGMLVGSFDESTRTVTVDLATGPSPDSRLSAARFEHGTDGTQALVEATRATTANRSGFVGMWHTHPYGLVLPSTTDEAGMADIVAPDGTGRRAVMLILGGEGTTWRDWIEIGTPPRVYARVVERAIIQRPSVTAFSTLVVTRWFPGGYTYPERRATDADSPWLDGSR